MNKRPNEYANSSAPEHLLDISLFGIPLKYLRVALWAVLAGLGAFALATINTRSVAADEFSMVWAAQQSPQLITSLFLSPRENNPPGCALLMHAWGLVFGYSAVSLRLFATLFVVAALAVLWRLAGLIADMNHGAQTSVEAANEQRGEKISDEKVSVASLLAFLLAATTPMVWMSANFARYQSLTMFLALVAVYAYLRWLRGSRTLYIALYAACTAVLFYIHYLPAATLAVSAGLHYLFIAFTRFKLRSRSEANDGSTRDDAAQAFRPQFIRWAGAQTLILALIAPLVYWIALAYMTIDLSAGKSNQLKAAPKFVAALLYGVMDGFVIPFWWVWVFVPSAIVFVLLLWKNIRNIAPNDSRYRGFVLWFVGFPFVFAAVVMAKMYPAETVFLYPAIQKIAYLAPLAWLVLGVAVIHIKHQWLRSASILVMVACNVYAVVVWNENITAVQHTPPLREITEAVRTSSAANNANNAGSTLVVHSFLYFYGPLGMGNADGALTAVQYNLPECTSVLLPETDVAPALTADSARTLASNFASNLPSGKQSVWIVQRNRYPHNAQTLATALTKAGFRLASEQSLQAQSSFDIWFKMQLLQRGIGGADPEPPQPYLYTLREFRR